MPNSHSIVERQIDFAGPGLGTIKTLCQMSNVKCLGRSSIKKTGKFSIMILDFIVY